VYEYTRDQDSVSFPSNALIGYSLSSKLIRFVSNCTFATPMSSVPSVKRSTICKTTDISHTTILGEVIKTSQMLHYALIATVVSLFYQLLSFTTVSTGHPTTLLRLCFPRLTAILIRGCSHWTYLFDCNDSTQIRSFVSTIAMVAGSTYAFSGLIWTVRDPRRMETLQKVASINICKELYYKIPERWRPTM